MKIRDQCMSLPILIDGDFISQLAAGEYYYNAFEARKSLDKEITL